SEVAPPAGLSFRGGLIGFLGYDLVRHIERLPVCARAESTVPDLLLYLADHVLAFDHAARRWYFCWVPWPDSALAERERVWERTLVSARGAQAPHALDTQAASTFAAGPPASNTPAALYLEHVRRCQDYIAAGDVFQVNLSHRLESAFRGDAFALYRRLTAVNPAPFAAFIPGDGFAVAGASPERFLRLEQGIVTARPIKGTRPRGAGTDDDRASRDALAASDKDRAENLMIVDLMRNDLGRVAQTGSVRVEGLFEMEAHPSVWQMVSTIRARLRDGANAADLLRACWPPGSMTGAPKVRAMQIIEELEPVRRGPYAGALGYFDVGGAMDLSVVIRTAVVTGERVAVQVGGAIVADSDPAAELAETYAKGSLLLRVLERSRFRT
ncbi:MAG TPA: aminodeoxychorismate synthase component I, partial [Burkholderiaceae bacterium]|nr:aminodeoxychorismate synthase component I [Burkholderiaceae bacterium]